MIFYIFQEIDFYMRAEGCNTCARKTNEEEYTRFKVPELQ
jgi:hypothetical protein